VNTTRRPNELHRPDPDKVAQVSAEDQRARTVPGKEHFSGLSLSAGGGVRVSSCKLRDRNVAESAVCVAGGLRQDGERVVGSASALADDDARGLLDDRRGGPRLFALLGQPGGGGVQRGVVRVIAAYSATAAATWWPGPSKVLGLRV